MKIKRSTFKNKGKILGNITNHSISAWCNSAHTHRNTTLNTFLFSCPCSPVDIKDLSRELNLICSLNSNNRILYEVRSLGKGKRKRLLILNLQRTHFPQYQESEGADIQTTCSYAFLLNVLLSSLTLPTLFQAKMT